MSSQQTHNVVVVGGNFGGVNIAHYLLRKTFVTLQKLQPQTSFRVTLISPNTHFYFKIAAPRALLDPTSIPEEKYFKSIAEAFKQYDASKFNHIQGKATGLDAQARTVSVDLSSDSKQESVKYDSLVIATGTSSSPLWTILDDHETTRAALKGLHEALPKASTVLIAGAGPVGVETAGEVASKYPNAKVTLITPSDRILPREAADLSAKATAALKGLGVVVKTNTSLSDLAATEETRPVKLSDGSSENPDVFINATGAHRMNTEWLPSDWLDDQKAVLTRDAYLRVKSKGSADDVKNVYAIGDVVSGAKRTAIELDAMVVTAASSIAIDLAGSSAAPAGSSDGGLLGFLNPFNKSGELKQVECKPMNAIIIPIGPNGGVGKAFGWNVPSMMVKKGKSEKFLLELVDPLITGKKWA